MSGRRTTSGLGGWMRQKLGCIMTFENADGKRLVLHRAGKPILECVREMCAEAVALDESFKVVSYSTAETILADMTGGRADMQHAVQKNPVGVAVPHTHLVALPEASVLSRCGLRDMLHPRLAQRSSAALMRQ